MTEKRVLEKKLSNGLTVLVCPKKDAAKVSVQLWYNVGSKHEKSGEKGIAHFIEHMIFKGTEKLSESDINLVTNKLSGYCNAFTSYDYTGYLFDIPVANWDKVLPIMADCMQNCSFKQEHLNSEVKAVIQELKMYKDNYVASLAEQMTSTIFEAHPYHHPIIGYKQDLWSVSRERLINFYKKHYTPNNAALVIVGDVDPEDVFAKAEASFGAIPAGPQREEEKFFVKHDITSKAVKLFRDVKQPIATVAFALPGISTRNEFALDILTYVLANGHGSRLYRKIVNELQLAVSIQSYVYDLFDRSLLFIQFNPKQESDISRIIFEIQKELDDIAANGLNDKELLRAQRLTGVAYQHLLENTQQQAYAIGKSFIALQDPQFPFSFSSYSLEDLKQGVEEIVKDFCHEGVRHEGAVVAVPQKALEHWKKAQELSDAEDAAILNAKGRQSEVEPGKYVETLELNDKKDVPVITPQVTTLENGLEVVWYDSDIVDTVEMVLVNKASYLFDPQDKQGLSNIVSQLMLEGTKDLPGQSFMEAVESHGMSIYAAAGSVGGSCLNKDVAVGLGFIADMMQQAEMSEANLEKIKQKTLVQIKQYWDNPMSFISHLASEHIYKNHPKSHMFMGTKESVPGITQQDCLDFYNSMFSPKNARLVISGNLGGQDVAALAQQAFGSWSGADELALDYPALSPMEAQEIKYPMNRDQITLMFAGLSLDRMHEDYDKVLLFDQILTGGVVMSMASRLFKLREQSGLFYTIGGSLLSGADKQPGMIAIRTIVSPDRVEEAERAILHELDTAIDTITEQELQEAKNILINTFDALYDSNGQKVSTFLFLRKFDLPFNYFENRVKALQEISLQDVQQAVKKILSADKLIRIKVGRV